MDMHFRMNDIFCSCMELRVEYINIKLPVSLLFLKETQANLMEAVYT